MGGPQEPRNEEKKGKKRNEMNTISIHAFYKK